MKQIDRIIYEDVLKIAEGLLIDNEKESKVLIDFIKLMKKKLGEK